MMIDEILDMMDDLLDNGQTVPFSVKKVIIDGDNLRNCINEVRLNMPTEMRDAKNIVMDRKTIIAEARKEADGIIKKAEDRAKIIVSNDEITKLARTKATEIMNIANSESKKLKYAANKYIDDILIKAETNLQAGLTEIKRTRADVKNHK